MDDWLAGWMNICGKKGRKTEEMCVERNKEQNERAEVGGLAWLGSEGRNRRQAGNK